MQTDFVLNDQVNGYPTRTVKTTATRDEIDRFVTNGYLPLSGLLSRETASDLAAAVLKMGLGETGDPRSEELPGQSIYIRGLFDKNAIFHPLLRLEPVVSMARTLLGPQLWVDLEARMNYKGREGVAVPWHGHLPVIPDPLPPLFCYPHQVHCLIYLDRITECEGALCLIPGSHMRPDIKLPLGDRSDQPDQVKLYFEPGDAVLIHANIWHQTMLSQPNAGYRRLLLLGYVPSWVRRGCEQAGVVPNKRLTDELAREADPELRELLGELRW